MSQTSRVGKTATKIFKTVEWNGNGAFSVTIVQYHDTAVVTFCDEWIKLNSGGWRTKTTKLRMNQTANQFDLNFDVFQKDYQWFVRDVVVGTLVPFEDGMILQRSANVLP